MVRDCPWGRIYERTKFVERPGVDTEYVVNMTIANNDPSGSSRKRGVDLGMEGSLCTEDIGLIWKKMGLLASRSTGVIEVRKKEVFGRAKEEVFHTETGGEVRVERKGPSVVHKRERPGDSWNTEKGKTPK